MRKEKEVRLGRKNGNAYMLTATRMSVKQLRTWERMVGVSTTIGLLTSDEAPTSTITCCLKEASELS